MQYQKKAILLKSKENPPRLAILNLEQRGSELQYSVSQRLDCMKECKIYLFIQENRWIVLEELNGKVRLDLSLQQIRAAGVIYDKGEIACRMSGETDPEFSWSRARANIRPKPAAPKAMDTKPRVTDTPGQNPAPQEENKQKERMASVKAVHQDSQKEAQNGQAPSANPEQPIQNIEKEIGEKKQIPIENNTQTIPEKKTKEQHMPQMPAGVSQKKIQEPTYHKEQPFVPPAVRAQTNCTEHREAIRINPFPEVFPESCWYKVDFPFMSGNWHYISGEIYRNGVLTAYATGVPGEYALAPPRWLTGFQTYLSAQAGAKGYWLMFENQEGQQLTLPELTNRKEA